MNISERLERLFGARETAGPASETKIRAVEEALQVTLPTSYRVFLSEYGAGWIDAPYTISGIRPDPELGETPLHSDVLFDNLGIRRQDRTGFFQKLVLISTDGGDCYIYLDTSKTGVDGECPVIVIAPGVDGLEVSQSFIDFAEKTARCDPLEGLV
jgi:hypothetical protein